MGLLWWILSPWDGGVGEVLAWMAADVGVELGVAIGRLAWIGVRRRAAKLLRSRASVLVVAGVLPLLRMGVAWWRAVLLRR